MGVVLTDLVMPGMNVTELGAAVRGRFPDTRVLYMSGYSDDTTTTRGGLAPGASLLVRPFGSAELTQKVRGPLDARG